LNFDRWEKHSGICGQIAKWEGKRRTRLRNVVFAGYGGIWVVQAYNALLAQHGAMASPHVKLQLLRSVHAALEECAAAAAADASTDAPRQVRVPTPFSKPPGLLQTSRLTSCALLRAAVHAPSSF